MRLSFDITAKWVYYDNMGFVPLLMTSEVRMLDQGVSKQPKKQVKIALMALGADAASQAPALGTHVSGWKATITTKFFLFFGLLGVALRRGPIFFINQK